MSDIDNFDLSSDETENKGERSDENGGDAAEISGTTETAPTENSGTAENIFNSSDERTEFEKELENYLPTPESTGKLKKPMPSWLWAVLASVLTTVILFALYSLLVVPHLKPSAVISYVQGSNKPDSADTSDLSSINEKVTPGIVTVSGSSKYTNFFGMSSSASTGSGIIISPDGYILTSNSLVSSDGETTVVMPDKSKHTATIVGADENKDIAILHINASNLPALTLANSDNVRPGDTSIVIGNMLGSALGTSITRGIICGVNKSVSLQNGGTINLLQTDAATTSNNAGGCLLNTNGEVIGMITYAISTNAGNISFAIPSNDIKNVTESLINTGSAPESPIIGITGTGSDHGVVIDSVVDDSPAKKSGLKEGDLILKVDDTPVKSVEEINKIRDTHKKGETIKITIYRDGNTLDVKVVL
ncbi:MAG: trypsin-like peptidase domain-containing protein [Firmicutes bacterium]|nr:trypsin-like peptidase domain-containing protein [Bacillota bacterium]